MLSNRGGANIDYAIGYEIESRLFIEYKPMLLKLLHATNIELTTRGILDKNTSTDATAVIENNVVINVVVSIFLIAVLLVITVLFMLVQ